MSRTRTRSRVTRALLAACLLSASSLLIAAPASAKVVKRTTTTSATTTTTTLPTPQSPPATSPDSCVKGVWPAQVSGKPASYVSGTDGVYLWYDSDGGWALRVTHTGAHTKVVYSGTLTSAAGKFVDVQGIGDPSDDIVYVSPNKHTVLFRFVNFGAVDGLNFATQCTSAFKVNVHAAGMVVPSSAVYLGAGGTNPTSDPFRVVRVAASSQRAEVPTTTVPVTVAS